MTEIQTDLVAKASVDLDKQVQEELKIEDPKPEKVQAILKDAHESNKKCSGGCQCSKNREGDEDTE